MADSRESLSPQKADAVKESRGGKKAVDNQDKAKRKQKGILLPKDDILLLTEAITVFPWGKSRFDRGKCWVSIAEAVNIFLDKDRHVDHRRAREHVMTLLEKHKKDEMMSLKASGTDEEYGEREQLLTDLAELIDNQTIVTNVSAVEKDEQERQDEFLRKAAMETLSRKSTSDVELGSSEIDEFGDGGSSSKSEKLKPKKKSRISEVETRLTLFMESDQQSRKQEMALLEKSQQLEESRQALEHKRLALKEARMEAERSDRLNTQHHMLQLMKMLASNPNFPKQL